MIHLKDLVSETGHDLNVESQTVGFFGFPSKTLIHQGEARIRATHDLPATAYISSLRSRSQRRTQGIKQPGFLNFEDHFAFSRTTNDLSTVPSTNCAGRTVEQGGTVVQGMVLLQQAGHGHTVFGV